MCLPFFSGQMQNVCRAQGFALFHITISPPSTKYSFTDFAAVTLPRGPYNDK